MDTLIGVVVGAFLGLVATVFYDRYKEHRTRRLLAMAIAQELQSLLDLVKEKSWDDFIMKENKTITKVELTTTYNYFTVYDSHTHLISLFEPNLMKAIVHFYNRAKAFLEDIRLYCEGAKVLPPDRDDESLISLKDRIKIQYETLQKTAREIIILANKERNKKFLWVIP